MAQRTIPVSVGTSNAGADLEAMLADADGAEQSSPWPVTTGFAMSGSTGWWTGDIPVGWRGGIRIKRQSDHVVVYSYALDPDSGSGAGANAVTVTVTDGTNPLQNVLVRWSEGADTFTATTDSGGVATFSLDDATYAVSVTKAGYSFTPTTETVDATHASFTLVMTQITVTPPALPNQSTGVAVTLDQQGNAKGNVVVSCEMIGRSDGTTVDGEIYSGTFTLTSDSQGNLSGPFVRLRRYEVWCGSGSKTKVDVPDAPSFNIGELISPD
jgi:hypothetical protein